MHNKRTNHGLRQRPELCHKILLVIFLRKVTFHVSASKYHSRNRDRLKVWNTHRHTLTCRVWEMERTVCDVRIRCVCVASPRLGLVSLSLCVIRQFIAALSVWQIVCNIAFCPFPNKLYVPRISIHGDGVRGPFICPKKKTCLDIRCHTHSECHFSSFSPFWTRKSIKMDKSGFNDL